MTEIETACTLDNFRRFTLLSTCRSFAPASYMNDPEVFPEREENLGSIYVEAADKVTLKKIRDITFVNARDVLGIIYTSKSGNTKLKWRQVRRYNGKVSGEASANSLVNLAEAGVITVSWAEEYMQKNARNSDAKKIIG